MEEFLNVARELEMKDFSDNSENKKINEECIENPDILNNLQDRTVEQNTVKEREHHK